MASALGLFLRIAMAQLTGDTLDNDLGITSEAPTWSPEIFDIVEVVFFCVPVATDATRVLHFAFPSLQLKKLCNSATLF